LTRTIAPADERASLQGVVGLAGDHPLHPAVLGGALARREQRGHPVERLVGARGAVTPLLGDEHLDDQICDEYADTELELLADFLRRTTDAGRRATDELAGD
jgi:hypothetical protein